jgi:hypothetical protein
MQHLLCGNDADLMARARQLRSTAADAAFDPHDIQAMARALDEVCCILNIQGSPTLREGIAICIIELARRGERSPTNLRDRLLAEAKAAPGTHPLAWSWRTTA